MRVLFVGDINEHTRTYHRLRAFRDLGHEVEAVASVPGGRISGLRGDDSLLFRITAKLRIPYDRTGANIKIRKLTKRLQPDLVWIEKGVTILPSTLAYVHKASAQSRLASFSEDDMFAKHNNSLYYIKCLRNYDMIFTTKSYNASDAELPALGASRVVFVDKAFDRYVHRPIPLSMEDIHMYGADVGFVGNFEQDRVAKLAHLAEKGFHVRVWGNGWKSMKGRNTNLMIEGRPIYGENYVKAICATRINMCFLRKLNRDLQTDRTMEIPACGAFMLGERTDEHRRLFVEGAEAEFFDSNEEMVFKVKRYLADEKRRQSIADNARRRCLESGYSHHERLLEMLAALESVPLSCEF